MVSLSLSLSLYDGVMGGQAGCLLRAAPSTAWIARRAPRDRIAQGLGAQRDAGAVSCRATERFTACTVPRPEDDEV
jgi:hypothetical protein